MSINLDSKYYERYYDHVLRDKADTGEPSNIGKIFDIIHDLSDRRGLGHEWEQIDGEIQDEIIEKWPKIINK